MRGHLKLKAPAKVNLTLEVLKPRDDGYHEISSILQTIDLCDELELEESAELQFFCDKRDLNSLDNLAVRAFKLLQKKAGIAKGARIVLKKTIPVAAGLGGGSSDAASLLKGLNILWGLKLSTAKLVEISAELGSDVPFFIQGGAAVARGRGGLIKPLPSPGEYWFVLLMPPADAVVDKTARMYGSITPSSYTQGKLTRSLAARIKAGREIEQSLLYNVFDEIAPEIYPRLPFFQALLAEAAGTDKAHLAGSGPCLFVMLKDKETAMHAFRAIKANNYETYMTRTLAAEEIV